MRHDVEPDSHMDVLEGRAWFGPVVTHQVHFPRRHLAAEADPAPVT